MNSERNPEAKARPDWLIDCGDIGELIRTLDWSATPIGPRDDWPEALKVITNLVLCSRFAMAILWGKELIFIYNHAYRIIAADKHPQAMGRSTREIWPEVWEFNKPIFKKVMEEGQTLHLEDQLFRLQRSAEPEDAYFTLSYSPIWLEHGHVGGTLVILVETTQRMLAEQELRSHHEHLESLVQELSEKTESLQDVNSALKVLLKQREEDKKDLEQSILINARHLILPYTEKLKQSPLNKAQATWVQILEAHLAEITSSFGHTLSAHHSNLTPAEIAVAGLVRDGMSTIQIAEVLGISPKTVCRHRDDIRRRLGLRGKGVNLRSYLLNLS